MILRVGFGSKSGIVKIGSNRGQNQGRVGGRFVSKDGGGGARAQSRSPGVRVRQVGPKERINGWMDEWMDGYWMDGWMDDWMARMPNGESHRMLQ